MKVSNDTSPSRSPLSPQHLTDNPLASSEIEIHSIGASSPQPALRDSSLPVLPLKVDDIARSYFTEKLETRDSKRIQHLTRAAPGFVKIPTLSYSSYDQLWSTNCSVFDSSETGHTSRIRRLYQGLRKIKEGNKEYDCAGRFALLFLRIEFYETVASVEDRDLSHGQKRATVAYERIALDLSITVMTLKSEMRRSRHYSYLSTKSGPSDLLELGDHVSTLWERELLHDDIDLLISFRKQYFPEVDKIFRDLDFLSTRILLHGLVAYGWTYKELSECRSDLITQLVKNVDSEQLAHGQVQASARLSPYNHEFCLPSPWTAFAAGHEDCESSGLSLDLNSQDKGGMSLDLLAEAATNVEPLILARAETLLLGQCMSSCEGSRNDTTTLTADIAAFQSSAHRSNTQTGCEAASQRRSLSTSDATEAYSQDTLDGNTSDPSLFPN